MTEPNKEAELAKSRAEFMQESLLDPFKPRFGLFSYSTLAIGDDSIGRKTKARRDQEGAVIIAPKNVSIRPLKRGKTADVYFSKPLFHTIGDPFEKRKSPRAGGDQAAVANQDAEGPFKPAGPFDPGFSSYPHEASDVYKKKNFRDAEGAVILPPKNILARPPKSGNAGSTPNLTFGSYPAITNEPFERKRQLEREERKRSDAKNMHEKAFRGTAHGDRNFANHVQTFGKTEMPARSATRPISVPLAEHDHPFKPANPAKKGIYDMTLGRFPEYKEGRDGKKPPRPVTDDRKWK
jgi:hypothetical protein